MKKIILLLCLSAFFIGCKEEPKIKPEYLYSNWIFTSMIKELGSPSWDELEALRQSPKINFMRMEQGNKFLGDIDGSYVQDTYSLVGEKLTIKNGKFTNYTTIFKLTPDTLLLKYTFADGKPVHSDFIFLYTKDNQNYDSKSFYHPDMNAWRLPPIAPLSEVALKSRMKTMLEYLHMRYESAIMKGNKDAEMGKLTIPFEYNYSEINLIPKVRMTKEWTKYFNNIQEANSAYDMIISLVKKTKIPELDKNSPGRAKEKYFDTLLTNFK